MTSPDSGPGRPEGEGPALPPNGAYTRRLPPGQYVPRGWPVLHYGRVPTVDLDTWDLRIFGATADGGELLLNHAELMALPQSEVSADFHCVTKFSLLDNLWAGIRTEDIARVCPPAPDATHVLIWADFGYSSNVSMANFLAPDSLFAHHRNGVPLTAEHGWPLRFVCPQLYAWKSTKWVRAIEYLYEDRRGFWEARGYHNRARVWDEQRYSYQEGPEDGPPL